VGELGAHDVGSSLEGTLLDKPTERRTLLKGGALGALASFFSFGPLSLAQTAKKPEFRLIEEKLVPVPAALRPGIESATRHFARQGFHIPRHFATYHKAAVGEHEVEWIDYHVASDAVNGRKAMIHAGLSKNTGPMVGGSITSWQDHRVTRLEAFEYSPAGFKKQATAALGADGEVATTIAPTAFHGVDEYAPLAPGLEKINRIQDALDKGEEACSCSCVCANYTSFPRYCQLICIIICGVLALICFFCGVVCHAICYIGCSFTVPCELFCAQCGCGSMTSTQCDYCCNNCF
jgi:hypothetical protein